MDIPLVTIQNSNPLQASSTSSPHKIKFTFSQFAFRDLFIKLQKESGTYRLFCISDYFFDNEIEDVLIDSLRNDLKHTCEITGFCPLNEQEWIKSYHIIIKKTIPYFLTTLHDVFNYDTSNSDVYISRIIKTNLTLFQAPPSREILKDIQVYLPATYYELKTMYDNIKPVTAVLLERFNHETQFHDLLYLSLVSDEKQIPVKLTHKVNDIYIYVQRLILDVFANTYIRMLEEIQDKIMDFAMFVKALKNKDGDSHL